MVLRTGSHCNKCKKLANGRVCDRVGKEKGRAGLPAMEIVHVATCTLQGIMHE